MENRIKEAREAAGLTQAKWRRFLKSPNEQLRIGKPEREKHLNTLKIWSLKNYSG